MQFKFRNAAVGIFAVGSIFALNCAPALATDFSSLSSWNGIYIGGNGGYGWGNSNRFINPVDALNVPFGNGDANAKIKGDIWGGQLGANWQFSPNWLIGLEAGFNSASLSGRATSVTSPTNSVETDMRWLATVTPRLGFVNGNGLLYVKGGLAISSIKTNAAEAGIISLSRADELTGWTIGAGLEYALSPNWIVGVEYDYYDLGSKSMTGVYTGAPVDFSQSIDPKFSAVMARISYKFGGSVN
jgi:outer membrane immunogenic protein